MTGSLLFLKKRALWVLLLALAIIMLRPSPAGAHDASSQEAGAATQSVTAILLPADPSTAAPTENASVEAEEANPAASTTSQVTYPAFISGASGGAPEPSLLVTAVALFLIVVYPILLVFRTGHLPI